MFVNQAKFPQPYPEVKMTLQELSGKPFAQRIFHPEEYLPKRLTDSRNMTPGEQIKIDLHITKPEIPVGGYTIDLI